MTSPVLKLGVTIATFDAMYSTEITARLQRIAPWLHANQLDGVLLSGRANFAWVSGGKDNHIVSASETGVVSLLVTADKVVCLANQIEAPRFRTEELSGTGIDVIDFPWWDPREARATAQSIVAGRRVAGDSDVFALKLPALPGSFAQLRWALTDTEIQRYRLCGQLASASLESVCRQIQPGDSEFDIAARIEFEVQRTGASPYVVLVATDQRIFNYRHPIPTAKKLDRYAMLVACAEYRGLIASCTRFVHFGPLPPEIRQKHQAACNVDAAVNLATKPGRKISEVFADLQKAYAGNGYPDEWKLHHQGGSTGYAGRDVIGTPFRDEVVLENQAFAWNPSIAGTKSEDTILVTRSGIEILTQCSPTWPQIPGHAGNAGNADELARPDILIR
jgi:Xaa-Pro dipeptidase